MKTFKIAIDGPGGAGKSTVAKALAERLGFVYLDTGAIYRTVACYTAMMGVPAEDGEGVARLMKDVNVGITFPEDGRQHMLLNGIDVTDRLRTPEMSMRASTVSAYPIVRDTLLDLQRNVAKEHDVIMDGRDIGTVVLPDADLKLFLTASPETRAKRRYDELKGKGKEIAYNTVLQELIQRDAQDTNRAFRPLRCAEDAVTVDSSLLTQQETIETILELVRKVREKQECI